MEFAAWTMTFFTALMGLAAVWAAVFDIAPVFESRKIAFLEQRLGRPSTRVIVGIVGLSLLALAISFVLMPPS